MNLIVLDWETFFGDGYSLSLKKVTTESYVRSSQFRDHGVGIKINGKPSKWVTHDKIPKVLNAIDWTKTAVIGHNLQFDGLILSHHYGIVPALYIDTLGMSRALIGSHSARHGLKYVAEIMCNMTKMDELSKSYNIRVLNHALEERIADYCVGAPRWIENPDEVQGGHWEAGDTELTWAVFKALAPHFPKPEYANLDWTIRAFCDPQLYLHTERLAEYRRELAEAKKQALINAGLENRDLLMSNQKYAEALENLGVEVPTKINKKGKVTFAFAKTDEAHKLLLEHEDERVQALVAARLEHKSTIEETRAELYEEASERGAWPVAYSFAGAQVTQRHSGNKGGGGNPQNLKRGGTLRKCIYAPEPWMVGVTDLSQIEARITLWLGMQITGPDGEEAKALKVMESGGDIYSWFGSLIYGFTISKKTHLFERQVAKSAVLGLGYGMGAQRFIDYCKASNIYGITPEFAEHIVNLYRQTFKGVAKMWRQAQRAVDAMLCGQYDVALPMDGNTLVHTCQDPIFQQPAIKLPSGLCIKYSGLNKDAEGSITYLDGGKPVNLFGGKIVENIVQAVAAWILRGRITKMSKHYRVVMQTHDELVCMIPEEDADVKAIVDGELKRISKGRFAEVAEEIMAAPVDVLPGLPLGQESDTAYDYGSAK